jgi:hypothetical protein
VLQLPVLNSYLGVISPVLAGSLSGTSEPKQEANRQDPGDMVSVESFTAYEILAEAARAVGLEAAYEVVPPPGLVHLNRPNLDRTSDSSISARRILMRMSAASIAGSANKPNEDWFCASSGLIVVLDGLTARTDTGCNHGVQWYVNRLGSALQKSASDNRMRLPLALKAAIESTASRHPECDLSHPGTPAAAVAIARLRADRLDI